MATLLQPYALENCQSQGNLRPRRFSFNPPHPEFLSQLRSSISNQIDSAVVDTASVLDDEPAHNLHPRSYSTSVPLSPLSGAHMSRQSTTVSLRYHETVLPTLSLTKTASAASFPRDEQSSSQASIIDLGSEERHPRGRDDFIKRRYISACFLYFLFGWGDGVTGTVLPYFQAQFNLSYMISSLLFAGSTCGFFSGTLLVERGLKYLGLVYPSRLKRSFVPSVFLLIFKSVPGEAKTPSNSQATYACLLLFSLVHSTFFIIMGSSTGFPMLFVAYIVAAFARAFCTASMNAYIARTSPAGLGYIYGCWSFGGAIAPIICQTIVATGVPWSHFYFGSLVLSAINIALVIFAFRPTPKELSDEIKENAAGSNISSLDGSEKGIEEQPSDRSVARVNALRLAVSLPYVWAFSIFLWLYCGSETTTQGLMATYLLATRHANPNTVGYVTSGFWGGVTISRFLWGYHSSKFNFSQKKRIIQVCLGFALVMHLLIWFVNSNIENSFSTAVIGLFYGPVYPAALAAANYLLPEEVHLVSMALLSAGASVGAALFPFITGTIASMKGAKILTYVTVSLTAIILCLWTCFPSKKRN